MRATALDGRNGKYLIEQVKVLRDDSSFEDVRHVNCDKRLAYALEKVKSYYPLCAYVVSENGRTVATSYANENVWSGQKTLFISSVKMSRDADEAKRLEVVTLLLGFYEALAKDDGYDAIIFEDSDERMLKHFESLGYRIIRTLNNFSGKRSEIAKNVSSRASALMFEEYKFITLDLEDIYKYSSFQDTRPGWNTSNLSIVKNRFNTMLALSDKSDAIYAICVYDDRLGLISRISVHPLSRRKGFGTYILKEAIHRMDCEYVFISDILKESENSLLFLNNIGFTLGEVKYEMHKELNGSYARDV